MLKLVLEETEITNDILPKMGNSDDWQFVMMLP